MPRMIVSRVFQEDPVPYAFYVKDREVTTNVLDTMHAVSHSAEEVVRIVYQPQAVFRVMGISQCSGTIPGHADNIVDVAFSPNGDKLVSGGGDKTVRFWDVHTATPFKKCEGLCTLPHAQTHAQTHTNTHTRTPTHTHTHTHTRTPTHTHGGRCRCKCILRHEYSHTHTLMYSFTQSCIHILMHPLLHNPPPPKKNTIIINHLLTT